jgi:GntR family transcriptional repressor for pyruvate dehydrogenase complex
VARAIEAQILRNEIGPGERLATEDGLCEQFGVSRSVIRDALRTLQAQGLISVRHGFGIVAAEPNGEKVAEATALLLARSGRTVEDVLRARAVLETELGCAATRSATDEDVAAAEAAFAGYRDWTEAGDWVSLNAAHLEFHAALVRAIHVPVLEVLLHPLLDLVHVTTMAPPQATKAKEVRIHEAILDALRDRDEAAMRVAMDNHFHGSLTAGGDYAKWRAMPLSEAVLAARADGET